MKPPGQRHTLLSLTALIGAVLVVASRTLPAVADRGYHPTDAETGNWGDLTLSDPPLGTMIPAISTLTSGRPAVVLVLGDCSACNVNKVTPLCTAQFPVQIKRIAMVLGHPSAEELKLLTARSPNLEVSMMTDECAKALDSKFLPRAYGFAASGRLVYLQPPSISVGNGVFAAEEAAVRGK